MNLPSLPAGVWRHYKGHFYLVLGYGHDANYEERNTVHYIGLELVDAHTGPRLVTQTAVSDDPDTDAWWDLVHEDRSKCTHHANDGGCGDGQNTQPRYEYMGPGWEGPGATAARTASDPKLPKETIDRWRDAAMADPESEFAIQHRAHLLQALDALDTIGSDEAAEGAVILPHEVSDADILQWRADALADSGSQRARIHQARLLAALNALQQARS